MASLAADPDNSGGKRTPSTARSARPTIPDVDGLSAYKSALAYSEGNLYVLPVDPTDTKNPGSIVGKGWPAKSTRDADVIDARWNVDVPPSIAIHTGRSGVVAFDFDVDGPIPDELSWLKSGQYQLSRPGVQGNERGVYLFASTETFVSGKFSLSDGTHVGEIRSGHSVFIAAPSAHAKAATGAGYVWRTHGPVPELPDAARSYLRLLSCKGLGRDGGVIADSDAVAQFKADTSAAGKRSRALGNLTGSLARKEAGTRDCLRNYLRIAATEARADFYPFERATAELEAAARASYNLRARDGEVGADFDSHIGAREFARLVANAVGGVLSRSEGEVLAEANRKYGSDSRANAGLADGLKFNVGSADPLTTDLADFWESSPQLRDLRQFAQSRRVGPAAMLGNSLARVVAAIPPNVVLPPTIGSVAGLNLFVALVGRSGESKSASMGASADWLTVDPSSTPAKPGSGEGLAKCFASVRRMPAANGTPATFVQIGNAWSVLAQLPEVDTLIATGGRGGSTIMSELRSAWSGERLGLDYASEDKRITLCANRYRLCLALGVQPLRSGPLFDDADGGTPQRFVWLPAGDTHAPSVRPDEPPRLELPRWPELRGNGVTDPDVALASSLAFVADPDEYRVLGIPDAARSVIDANQLAVLRGDAGADPLDGHRLLVRLKLAAALMALECRYEAISDADWQRAEVVMTLSDATRKSARKELTAKEQRANVNRGRAEGERADVAEQVKTDRAVERVAENIARKLTDNGSMARSDVRRKIRRDDREYFDDAEALLIESGRITKSVAESASGSDGHVLCLAGQDSK